tara:strand:+ start:4719 stop:5132 length:414 start_codon:yes stop_codon:yes gene_type:complete
MNWEDILKAEYWTLARLGTKGSYKENRLTKPKLPFQILITEDGQPCYKENYKTVNIAIETMKQFAKSVDRDLVGSDTFGEMVRDGEVPVLKYAITQKPDKKGKSHKYYVTEDNKLGFYTPEDEEEYNQKNKVGDEEE